MEWVDAAKSHRLDLPSFTCTTAKPRSGGRTLPHPKPWEWEVQAFIRRLRPPLAGEVLLLGIAQRRIASVVNLAYYTVERTPVTFIRAIAVSVEWRGQGGSLADETIVHAIRRAGSDLSALGFNRALAAGHVAPSNTPGQRLLERSGFRRTAESDSVQRWERPFSW
ncbi:MAG: GNAT family N-acetyltransferase [Candidatus Nanopelagicales bacterium]|nr:GNAT family N-acetyltransferase [Candidatus Nanopelagicales bacterium]MDZ4249262.1 GNAT family N-acetyltransferase [Candidatus Nanopelagicales bacterium]MDZ7577644.1 GNAT family N-acetyltransferase [Candidatus Nanopelagicales bacterium]